MLYLIHHVTLIDGVVAGMRACASAVWAATHFKCQKQKALPRARLPFSHPKNATNHQWYTYSYHRQSPDTLRHATARRPRARNMKINLRRSRRRDDHMSFIPRPQSTPKANERLWALVDSMQKRAESSQGAAEKGVSSSP